MLESETVAKNRIEFQWGSKLQGTSSEALLCDYRGVCLCLFSPTVTKTFDTNCIKFENFGLKLVSDGNLEILLDNADDANTNKLIKYVVTQF